MTGAWQWQGEPSVSLVDVPARQLAAGDVRLRPVVNGICATDRELLTGNLAASRPPLVPGHEIVAEVVDGSADSPERGALVVVDTIVGCGACHACRDGRTQLCADAEEIGLTRDGGWCEEVVAPAPNCRELPPDAPPRLCALVEPLQCVLGLVRDLAPAGGDRLLVVGSGVAAFLAVGLGRLAGAEVVASVDDAERGRLASALGADEVMGPGRRAPSASCTHAVDAVGSEASLAECVDALRPGGRLGLYGLVEAAPRFDLQRAIFKNLTLTGHTSAPWLWPEAIALVCGGELPLEPLITDVVPFADVGVWVEEWVASGGLHGPHVKAVIEHGVA
jgi:threonine dehydrogenase-like Zn-dependent dehydrogenase